MRLYLQNNVSERSPLDDARKVNSVFNVAIARINIGSQMSLRARRHLQNQTRRRELHRDVRTLRTYIKLLAAHEDAVER